MMESFMSRGLRKGAWTEEEDELLKKCVLKFGEGKWHQVPLQAGLNRCRKSCRIRWLNYLNPSIKRGEFEEDEVDLILKLHRLLGNRWSMIAGRIPERTANDIKNYWNTHLKKNKQHQQRNCKKKIKIPIKETTLLDTSSLNSVKTTVFKPRPRTFSKTSPWIWKSNDDDDVNNVSVNNDRNTCSKIENQVSSAESVINGEEHDSNKWWESLLFDKEVEASNHEKFVVQYDNWWESLLFNNEVDYCDFENHYL